MGSDHYFMVYFVDLELDTPSCHILLLYAKEQLEHSQNIYFYVLQKKSVETQGLKHKVK